MSDKHEGGCFCGAVRFELSGAPAMEGYCHCVDCRAWSAGPVNGFTLWPIDAVTITKGAESVGTFAKTENSHRKHCTVCGGALMTEHPGMGLMDVYAALVEGRRHEPSLHVWYSQRMIDLKDGLPKFRDMPDGAGGSGEMMDE